MDRRAAEQLAAQLRGFGGESAVLPPWLVEALNASDTTDVIDVLAPNWNAVQVFHRCRSQAGFGGFAGITTVEIQAVTQTLGVSLDVDLLDRVRLMEGEAARIFEERAEVERKKKG